jgi:hypothetical protein
LCKMLQDLYSAISWIIFMLEHPVIFIRRVWRYQRVISKSKDRQHNDQKEKNKRTNNDLQNIHIKLKTSNMNPTQMLRKSSSSCSTSGTYRVNLVTNPVINKYIFPIFKNKLCRLRLEILWCAEHKFFGRIRRL